MDTTVKSYRKESSFNTAVLVKPINLNYFWKYLEFNRFGIIPLLVVFITALGGIAIAFGAGSDTLKLSLVTFPTIMALALVLAVAPMRLVFWVSAISLLFDVIIFFL